MVLNCKKGTKKALGLPWMAIYLYLDMMKRTINALAWPYTGIEVYGRLSHGYVGLKGFVYSERYDMYLARAQRVMAALMNPWSSLVPKILFFADCWHMKYSSLHEIFGSVSYNHLKPHLWHDWCRSSWSVWRGICGQNRDFLINALETNGETETKLDDLADK